jgi:hypothetical protein
MARQSVRPDKIVLYLSALQFPDRRLPDRLARMQGGGFEIRWLNSDFRGHKKLIPALRDFPNDIIVTVDDDIAYRRGVVETLLREHRENPDCVIAMRAKNVEPSARYADWRKLSGKDADFSAGFGRIGIGYGGILYPPHILHPDASRPELFMRIAPSADDLWFWAMAALNGKMIKPVRDYLHSPVVWFSQGIALRRENFRAGASKNDEAMARIIARYPELLFKL